MSHGLTEREKAIWPPKQPYFTFWEKVGLILIVLSFLAVLYHFTFEPDVIKKGTTPIVQGQPVSYESDEQICKWATHGVPVKGANINQIEMYCLVHG